MIGGHSRRIRSGRYNGPATKADKILAIILLVIAFGAVVFLAAFIIAALCGAI